MDAVLSNNPSALAGYVLYSATPTCCAGTHRQYLLVVRLTILYGLLRHHRFLARRYSMYFACATD